MDLLTDENKKWTLKYMDISKSRRTKIDIKRYELKG